MNKNDSYGACNDPCVDYGDDLPEAEVTEEDKESELSGPESSKNSKKENSLEYLYPIFALNIKAGPLELRVLRDEDFPMYAELLRESIFDPQFREATFPWVALETEDRIRSAFQYQWAARASLDARSWRLPFGVFHNGELVGSQEINSQDFMLSRTVKTGSWLTRRMHGQGIGTLMRQAVLVFAFDYLKAKRAESDALMTNIPSIATSRKLGYVNNGTEVKAERDRACEYQRLVLHADALVRPDGDVTVDGLTPGLIAELGAD